MKEVATHPLGIHRLSVVRCDKRGRLSGMGGLPGRRAALKGTDPRGYDYYWFGLHGIEHTPEHETDLEAISDDFISVTPLQLDLTHKDSLALLKAAYGASS